MAERVKTGRFVYPLRKVLSVEFVQSRYSMKGQGSNWLRLECGHEMRQKSSIPVPKSGRCWFCPPVGEATGKDRSADESEM